MTRRTSLVLATVTTALLCAARVTLAQETNNTQPAETPDASTAVPGAAATADSGAEPTPATGPNDTGKAGKRMFGVLPNYTTVEGARRIQPISTKQMFHMAAEDAFDKPVFPFVAFTSWLAGVQGEESSWGRGPTGYAKRYATTFSDDVVATFLTTAIMPTILHQDPRYFELGHGNPWHRIEYAASRSFVTLSRSAQSEFNYSDVTGNFIAAAAANVYHPAEDRSLKDTTLRWGTQMMWDVLSDELKEFWPDIRHKVFKR